MSWIIYREVRGEKFPKGRFKTQKNAIDKATQWSKKNVKAKYIIEMEKK
jgi:hypothetical protein